MSTASKASAGRSFASVDEWISKEAIPFALTGNAFDEAVDRLMARLGDQVSVLGIGEPIHSGDEFLTLRNRLFQRLVEAHGFCAITIENNDMRARHIDDYVHGRGGASFETIQDKAFTAGIGHWNGNRELIEWIRTYNANASHDVKLNVYGTLASDQETTKSPREAIELALAYLRERDAAAASRWQDAVSPLLGQDAEWEEPATTRAQEIAALVIAGKDVTLPPDEDAIGLSARARSLRLAVEELIFELRMRAPEFAGDGDGDGSGEAMRHLTVARNLLAMHAAMARGASLDTMVSMRDAMAAEHIGYIAGREKKRGKVLVFLHSIHLRRSRATLPWYTFWPTGAHLDRMFGPSFAVIAGALGTSEGNLVATPDADSLEGRLLGRHTDCFLPTLRGKALPDGAIATLPVRAGGPPYIPYTPLVPESIADFDAIAFLQAVTYTRGAPPMPS